jgi:hypothetical protein
MAVAREAQLNIRSRFARERAAELARLTGLTTTQVVEEALRAFDPPRNRDEGRLVRKGKLLVMPATGRTLTLEEVNEAIEAVREERG